MERDLVRANNGGDVFTSHRRPAIFIDISSAINNGVAGGIKRVCESIYAALVDEKDVHFVAYDGKKLSFVPPGYCKTGPVYFIKGDRYLILDDFWTPRGLDDKIIADARTLGVKVGLCIHDVMPVIKPEFLPTAWADFFQDRLRHLLPQVDYVVSVSKTSALEVQRVLCDKGAQIPIGWFYLGSDSFTKIRTDIITSTPPSFVSIGTVEPKKGYACSIDAFDQLWAKGINVNFVIFGKSGWLCEDLERRILSHNQYNKQLFWFTACSDYEISLALAECYCFLQASLAEGFGLPLAEAAAFCLPIIASDIPVFREIAIDNVTFFPPSNSNSLAGIIEKVLSARPRAANIIQLSWKHSAENLCALIDELT